MDGNRGAVGWLSMESTTLSTTYRKERDARAIWLSVGAACWCASAVWSASPSVKDVGVEGLGLEGHMAGSGPRVVHAPATFASTACRSAELSAALERWQTSQEPKVAAMRWAWVLGQDLAYAAQANSFHVIIEQWSRAGCCKGGSHEVVGQWATQLGQGSIGFEAHVCVFEAMTKQSIQALCCFGVVAEHCRSGRRRLPGAQAVDLGRETGVEGLGSRFRSTLL